MSDEIVCPYCGNEMDEYDFDSELSREDDGVSLIECLECGKIFKVHTSVSYSFDTETCDCQNGCAHDWKPTATSPKCATKMRCSMCEEEREPTQEEKIKYGIPSYEDYFAELKKGH